MQIREKRRKYKTPYETKPLRDFKVTLWSDEAPYITYNLVDQHSRNAIRLEIGGNRGGLSVYMDIKQFLEFAIEVEDVKGIIEDIRNKKIVDKLSF